MSEGGEAIKQSPAVEKSIIDKLGGSIITESQFEQFRNQNGFTDGWHGTWRRKESPVYLYTKPCHIVDTEQQAQASLKAMRHLTEKGILYPQTQWGIYHTKERKFQLFAITRELERWSPELNGKNGRELLKLNIGEKNDYKGMLDRDSHILQWVQRIDLNFEGELALLLNVYEAAHPDNWAYGEDGKLYPIDVEVVTLNYERDQERIGGWVDKNK